MGKPPAFQLYAADFYMDTAHWTPEEVGVYFRLLMFEWVNKTIPNNTRQMARISGLSPKKFTKTYQIVSPKFVKKDDENLINLKMESIREKQDNYRESQAIAGKKGAKKRWNIDSNPNGDPIGEPNGETIALQSSSSNNTIPYSEIVSYLNLKTGKSFKHTTKETQRFIKARFKSGFTVEDFFTVIDNQSGKWLSKPDMIDYLRPETLFGTKFESYLQTKPAEPEVKYEYLGMPG